MKLTLLFGSYREPSLGRRLVAYLENAATAHGFEVSVLDAKALGFPILEKKFSEYDDGTAPEAMARASQTLAASDAYIMVAGEYNATLQPGLSNLMDHFLPEYAQKPVGIACYSPGALGGARVSMHIRPFVANLGMLSLPQVLGVGAIHEALGEDGQPQGDGGARLKKSADGFLEQLKWYAEALSAKRLAKD
jgi:NAD(P)H-dependent FMN reductase